MTLKQFFKKKKLPLFKLFTILAFHCVKIVVKKLLVEQVK